MRRPGRRPDVGPVGQLEPAAPAKVEKTTETRTPSLYPTTDEVRAQVRANEQARGTSSKVMTERDWLYLVAAIAVGVIIAAVVLD